MLLILTHENADFDAVASQLAAHKLYPDGIPLLSRRVNRNVNQFLALYWDALPYRRPENWRRKRVDQIVLVDTQAVPSVRGVREDAGVTVIDHHLPVNTRPAWSSHVEPLGATTTLLIEMLRERGFTPAPVEATLLLLGIYEDTGCLTYDTTTPRDALAAAWLLEQDAQLSLVRRFLDVPLSAGQQALYQALQLNSEWLHIEGHTILIAATDAPPDFKEEISAIAHRMRDALAPDGLIILVGLPHHVQMVARSTTADLDVSVLARALGGGGHGRAAAATIVDITLAASVERVKQLLADKVHPAVRVVDIMSRGVQTLAALDPVHKAARQMQRFGHEGYPVVDEASGRLVGLLTRRAVDRALNHGLEQLRVEQIMRSGRVSLKPEDSIVRVQQLMITEGWGQLPVLKRAGNGGPDELLGIVTRTDLLRLLSKPLEEEPLNNLRKQLSGFLPPAHWRLVQLVSKEADAAGMPIYFVGGLVRDLLLRKPAVDMDIVVEGDAISLAKRLSRAHGGRIRSHGRFGTAKWLLTPAIWREICPDSPLENVANAVDFVTARTEFYTAPTALPEVTHSSIKLDLHRRDFTINTLAVRLDGPHLGELLDFYGGLRDLETGLVRVLHSLSFIDDPTRILRAVRLEQRLAFRIESRTVELIAAALPMLERVTGARIRHEIEQSLEEEHPEPVLQRLAELKVLSHIHPALTWQPLTAGMFVRLRSLLDGDWVEALLGGDPIAVTFTLWMMPLAPTTRGEVMTRLRVRKSTREIVEGAVALLREIRALPANALPSVVERAVRPFASRPQLLLAVRAAVGDGSAGEQLDNYWRKWRHVQTALDGHDLRQLGLKPSPRFAVLLDRLLAARLDGVVTDEAGERQLLDQMLATGEDAG